MIVAGEERADRLWVGAAEPPYTVPPGQLSCGVDIGVLCQDCRVAFIPGDVQNATSFSFPIRYTLVPGANVHSVLRRRDPELAPAFVRAARDLERQGVRAITGNCGYMLAYQEQVAASVSVPVLLSSLLQLPMLLTMLGPQRKVGVLVADGERVDEAMMFRTGVPPKERQRVVVCGLEDKPAFRSAILEDSGVLDRPAVAAEVVEAACEMVDRHPDIGAIHLECSNLPPYSAQIQAATGRPVFDWIGFIEWVRRAVVPPTFPRPNLDPRG